MVIAASGLLQMGKKMELPATDGATMGGALQEWVLRAAMDPGWSD
jgi:hypothetical protein